MHRLASVTAAVAATITGVVAQRPSNVSICDYYTTALLKDNTADNQATLLTLVVNTVVIGNYTEPNVGIEVPGILAKGDYHGVEVNLLPYFDGTLASSNRGGSSGVSVNFLDGGGADPLKMNKPANDMTSRQYFLLTHLYQFFGSLLGCSMQGMPGFDAYMGHASMYEVHKFMALDENELGYFITQVGTAAASFGVAEADVTAVGEALNKLFGYRCAPETAVIPAQGSQLQAICIEESCPVADNATCAAYEAVVEPMTASMTASMTGSMEMSSTMSMSGSTSVPGSMGTPGTMTMAPTGTTMIPTTGVTTPTTIPTAAAAVNGIKIAAVAAGIFAFFL